MIATLPTARALFALQAPASQNCRDPQAQSDMNICASIAFERVDAELNAEYRRAVARARAADRAIAGQLPARDHRPGAEDTLREAQRAWVAFRDAHCRLEGYQSRGGSMEPMLYEGCRAAVTRERTVQLRRSAAADQ